MLDCLILGDSLAVGVGQARPACTTIAKVGITSGTYIAAFSGLHPGPAHTAVISLGVNDDPSMATADNLRRLRAEVKAARVVWLLPGLKDDVRKLVLAVASANRDGVVDTKPQAGPDHLHPGTAGYRVIADQIIAPAPGGRPAPAFPSPFAVQTAALPQPLILPMGTPSHGALPNVFYASRSAALGPGLLRSGFGPGAVYGLWPPADARFAAFPPKEYAYHALPPLPLPAQATPPR